MSIAINSNFERNQLTASFTGQTVFSYTFPIYDETFLSVFQYSAGVMPDDATQELALGIDYSVTGVQTETGGTIILNVGATINDIITIVGTQPIERVTQFQDLNPFTVAMNEQLNELTIMIQQVYTYWNNFTPRYNADELVSDQVRPFKRILPMLPDGHVWVGRGSIGQNPDDIITQFFVNPAGGTTATITQSTAGLTTKMWMRVNSAGVYVPALGDNAGDAEVIGVIIEIVDSMHFIIQQSGYVSPVQGIFSGLTVSPGYFLSTTNPGVMTLLDATQPPTVSRPVFVADSPTSGWVLPYRGLIVGGGIPGGSGGPPGGLGLTWVNVSGGTTVMTPFTGYIVTGASLTTLVLPPNFNPGDLIVIYNYSTGGYLVNVGAGQLIQYAQVATTTGSPGSISSSTIGDSLMLIGLVANVAMGEIGANGWQPVT